MLKKMRFALNNLPYILSICCSRITKYWVRYSPLFAGLGRRGVRCAFGSSEKKFFNIIKKKNTCSLDFCGGINLGKYFFSFWNAVRRVIIEPYWNELHYIIQLWGHCLCVGMPHLSSSTIFFKIWHTAGVPWKKARLVNMGLGFDFLFQSNDRSKS